MTTRAKDGTRALKFRDDLRTLWRAKLRFPGDDPKRGQEFLFRDRDDFSAAAVTAQRLLAESTAANMAGVEIVLVERVAQLWN